MASSPIVAAVQFEPRVLDVYKNLGTARMLALEAATKGANIIVLPELCASGYALRNRKEASECSQTRRGYQTEAFIPIAKQYNCHIVMGYVELYENILYNSAAVIGPNGLVANYQKHNLWANDFHWAEASSAINPVITTPAGRLGVLICRDSMNNYRESYTFHKDNEKFYKKGSVDTIALLTSWGGLGHPDHSWIDLAEQTNANIIVSNRVGKERDLQFKGGSCIVTRSKKVYTHGSSFLTEAVVGGTIEL